MTGRFAALTFIVFAGCAPHGYHCDGSPVLSDEACRTKCRKLCYAVEPLGYEPCVCDPRSVYADCALKKEPP